MTPEVQSVLLDKLSDLRFAARDLLETIEAVTYYAERLDTVEVNSDDA